MDCGCVDSVSIVAFGKTMKADIISIDPAWDFKTYSENGRGRCPKYRTEALDQIAALPIGDLANDNCALFLWVTWPFLFDAPNIVSDWGFEYKTLAFEWWKLNKKWWRYFLPLIGSARDYSALFRMFAMGGGYYSRANSEPCLLCIKGKMPRTARNVRNYIIAPLREPGRKPDEQYGKIEALYPAEKYPNRVELYARQQWDGWIALGDRMDGMNLSESIPMLIEDNYPVVDEVIEWQA